MRKNQRKRLINALWRIYHRPMRPVPWAYGGNLPWNEPEFSERMLAEHLDQSHGAASRCAQERSEQISWLWNRLGLKAGNRILDVTCGPGLYAVDLSSRGCVVTGVDFAPAAIRFAHQRAADRNVARNCAFVQADIHYWPFKGGRFDAALLLYGQLAVMRRQEAKKLLSQIAASLRPGGLLCLEILNQERVDQKESTWWYSDDQGIWGEGPFIVLGERFWQEDERISIERYHVVHLESGKLDEIILCDQTYSLSEMVKMLLTAGFAKVDAFPHWEELPLADKDEWIVILATAGNSPEKNERNRNPK